MELNTSIAVHSATLSWSNVSDLQLIKLVESFPILYDRDLARGVKNANKKDEAWRQVSLHLNASERACITRWKSIRDRFGKEYRRVLECPDEPVTWEIFPDLMFLKDHYKHGRKDELPDINYQPKARKRRIPRPQSSTVDDDSNNEEELDEDARLLNHQLIELVKKRPVLYDKYKIRDSKNLTAKNDAWQQISQTLSLSEETCYKRWKKLRDRFAREYRRHSVYPDHPVQWEYFKDLIFLEGHYRKGIPLNVSTLKRIPRTPKADNEQYKVESQAAEDHWSSNDYPFDCMDSEQALAEDCQDFGDMQNSTYIEFPTEVARDQKLISEHSNFQLTAVVQNSEPEEQLCSVISNIETVLQQSQECLHSLREQQERHRKEINDVASAGFHNQPVILQKMNVLLDGLTADNRDKAERKILQFLCECQIKTLKNEDIDDVFDTTIY